jgi:hypothetical protein
MRRRDFVRAGRIRSLGFCARGLAEPLPQGWRVRVYSVSEQQTMSFSTMLGKGRLIGAMPRGLSRRVQNRYNLSVPSVLFRDLVSCILLPDSAGYYNQLPEA